MWWVANQKTGASAIGLQQVLELGSYETAWTWLHKLRRAMVRPGRDRLTGRVEVDEAYISYERLEKHGYRHRITFLKGRKESASELLLTAIAARRDDALVSVPGRKYLLGAVPPVKAFFL